MKAIIQERSGPPDVLQFVDADLPHIGPDDVLVRVHAATINPYDWHMLRGDPYIARLFGGDAGQARAGQRVVVNGAAGGVGSFAVQIAAALGAEVTGVCSTRNVELVRSIGARARHRPHRSELLRRARALRRDPRQRRQPAGFAQAMGVSS